MPLFDYLPIDDLYSTPTAPAWIRLAEPVGEDTRLRASCEALENFRRRQRWLAGSLTPSSAIITAVHAALRHPRRVACDNVRRQRLGPSADLAYVVSSSHAHVLARG